jgi:uncharacterized protein with NAD-binding domain and iron-sulfur cluster
VIGEHLVIDLQCFHRGEGKKWSMQLQTLNVVDIQVMPLNWSDLVELWSALSCGRRPQNCDDVIELQLVDVVDSSTVYRTKAQNLELGQLTLNNGQ